MSTPQKRALTYAITAVLCWSTVATAFKIGLRYVSPATLLFWATVSSLLALGSIMVFTRTSFNISRQPAALLARSALYGLLNPFLYYLILFEAYRRLPGQVAQPLNMIWPILLVFLSAPFLKQKITVRNMAALLISFLGVIWISSQGRFFQPGQSDTTGVILALGSAVVWSFFWILNLKDNRPEGIKLFTNFLFALIYIIIYMIVTHQVNLPPWQGLLAGIYTGFFEMGFTFYLWLKALQNASTTAGISNLVYVSPFLSLVFLHFIAGEHIFLSTLAGLLLILTGIILQNLSFKKKK